VTSRQGEALRHFACAFAVAATIGCGQKTDERETAAKALTGAEVCAADGMILRDYDGPKAQILWKDGRRTFYCEAREAFALWLDRIRSKQILAFYVQDFADRPWGNYKDHWILAQDAIFVIESERQGAMGSSFVSFRDSAHADAFSAEQGGRQLRLAEITPDVYAASQQTHLERLIEGDSAASSVVRVTRPLMGALFELAAWVPTDRRASTRSLMNEALEVIAELEGQISSWDPGSETSAVNRAAGLEPVSVGADLQELVEIAVSWAERTGGAFDVTVAPLVDLWKRAGIEGELPGKIEIQKELVRVGFKKILVGEGTLFLPERGMRLGFGAVGKGFAADRAAELLLAAGVENFIVGAGGDLVVRGARGAQPWQVGVRDPSGRGLLAVSPTSNRAIATSGDYEQFIAIGGHRYSHILDPRSGEPVSGLTSVTVFSARAVDSDALATALIVMGSDQGIEFVEELPDVEALFVTEDGSAILSSGLRLEGETLEIFE
jgi:thiamine biosynthesis lipoprotein